MKYIMTNSRDKDLPDQPEEELLPTNREPIDLFHEWMQEAQESEVNDPTAMCLSTVDANGMPNNRMVLLKDASQQGFTFYTNYESAKGKELLANPTAALCFHWKSLRKQVRIRGNVKQVTEQEADAYFASRPKGSQIGAWASKQSRELEERYALEKSVAFYTAKFNIGNIPRPDYWSGFRLEPLEIEFWKDKPFRLHDRVVFLRKTTDEKWANTKLYP